jgi:hypothetical protein
VDLVVLDGEREDEAAEDERDDVVHVGLGDGVGAGDAEEREEEERRHGRDRQRHGAGDPPEEHPREHGEHVARAAVGPAEVDERAHRRARRGARRHRRVPVREQRARPRRRRRPLPAIIGGQREQRRLHVLGRRAPALAHRLRWLGCFWRGGRAELARPPWLFYSCAGLKMAGRSGPIWRRASTIILLLPARNARRNRAATGRVVVQLSRPGWTSRPACGLLDDGHESRRPRGAMAPPVCLCPTSDVQVQPLDSDDARGSPCAPAGHDARAALSLLDRRPARRARALQRDSFRCSTGSPLGSPGNPCRRLDHGEPRATRHARISRAFARPDRRDAGVHPGGHGRRAAS